MARVTKQQLINEILEVVSEFQKVHSEVFEMYQNDEIKWGEYYIFGLYDNFHYKTLYGRFDKPIMLYGTGKQKSRVWDFQYHLRNLKEDLDKARNFIEEKKETSLI